MSKLTVPAPRTESKTSNLVFLLNCRFVGNLAARCFLFDAVFDNGDFLAREAVKGIDKLVDLGFKRRDITVRVGFLGGQRVLVLAPVSTVFGFAAHKFPLSPPGLLV